MSEQQSNSGVRNIRAMFEAKKESTSPPSRGRSPVGSEGGGSTSSRPISKVRTSFVAVERSGQMGPQLGQRKMSNSGERGQGAEGGIEPKIDTSNMDPEQKELPKTNGVHTPEPTHTTTALENVKEEDTPDGVKEDFSDKQDIEVSAPSQQHERSLDGPNASEAADADDLGSVLKGSPFQAVSRKTAEGSAAKQATPNKPLQIESTAEKRTPNQSREKSTGTEGASVPKSSKSTKPTPTTPRPLPIRTKQNAEKPSKPSVAAPSAEASKSPRTPRTPKSPAQQLSKVSSPRQPLSKTSSPRQPIPEGGASKPAPTEPSKVPAKKPSISSTKTVMPNATKSRSPPPTNNAQAARKPVSSSGKQEPKLPTRPVRLPASATAPTAASAAKVGGAPPPRSPSRASTTAGTSLGRKPSTFNKSRGPPTGTTSSHLPTKTSRPSLERPKSRTGTAWKASDGGFLARMMRPTASSASKVHEKIEPKSPPRKVPPTRLNRKSEASEDGKLNNSDAAHATAPPVTENGAPEETFPDREDSILVNGTANGTAESTDPTTS